jgi:uncharacterized protein
LVTELDETVAARHARTGAVFIALFVNVLAMAAFLRSNADRLLSAVVDPLHPDWNAMERAFAGFSVFAAASFGVLLGLAGLLTMSVARRTSEKPRAVGWRRLVPYGPIALLLTAMMVLVVIEVLVFQDYGIHFYEFDVFGILANAAFRRDLGIQPAEVARVTGAAVALLAAELALLAVAIRMATWRNRFVPKACAMAMVAAIPAGLIVFHQAEQDITSDRADFESALPLGRQLLMRTTTRPFIPVAPRLGAGGYPVADSASPTLGHKPNVVFFVSDGLRGDMVRPELTPNLLRFGSRPEVIHSQRHFSTGHVSEAGIFGLLYSLRSNAFNAFVGDRVRPYPLELLKKNGYHTLLIASSRLSPYPSDQLVSAFDQVVYPENDDSALVALREYVTARHADGRPYFVLSFVYTPHFPFTSAKPPFRKFPLVGPKARTNYMNDVLQADDYFRQTYDLVRDDYEAGRTIILATADHGEEIRDHGVFGHASATFWNEKLVVPFFLGLPGRRLDARAKAPTLSTHADVWPTIFDYLGLQSSIDPLRYSDGRSLLAPPREPATAYVAGRFFPWADKPSVLVDDRRKYWFRVTGVDTAGQLCIVPTRITDLDDRSEATDPSSLDPKSIPAFQALQATFWRHIRVTGPQTALCSRSN